MPLREPLNAPLHHSANAAAGGETGASAATQHPVGRSRRGWRLGALLVVVACTGVATLATGWQRWLAPPWGEIQGQVDAQCRLDQQPGGCQARFADGSVMHLRLSPSSPSPRSAPSSAPAADAPITLRLTLSAAEARSIAIDLNGETMNMGPNLTEMLRQPDGSWAGTTALSACISGQMTWVLTARAKVGGGERVARYRFETGAEPSP